MSGAGAGSGEVGGVGGVVSDGSPPGEGGPEANLTAARFQRGTSGNPGGRPKDLPRFRQALRTRSWEWLAKLDALMAHDGTAAGDKLAIWKAVCDRGGFLPSDRQASVDAGNARLLVLAAALRNLSDGQREAILSMLGEIKGDEGDPPAP